MTTPTGFRAGRHLILLSNIKTSGAGLLELIADNDSNLDGTVQLSAMVQVFGASGTGSGTVFISGDDVKVSLGALIHLDQGDLLVTATDFRFGSAPECSRGASLSMELVNQLTGVGGNLSIVGSASFVSGGSVNCHGFVASMSIS